MAIAEGQLSLDALEHELSALLAKSAGDGAGRLLAALVKRGLAERDIVPAAGLVLALESDALERKAPPHRDRRAA